MAAYYSLFKVIFFCCSEPEKIILLSHVPIESLRSNQYPDPYTDSYRAKSPMSILFFFFFFFNKVSANVAINVGGVFWHLFLRVMPRRRCNTGHHLYIATPSFLKSSYHSLKRIKNIVKANILLSRDFTRGD